jgi:inositol phosphorylceramide mannosyltransferase catalytic subunit
MKREIQLMLLVNGVIILFLAYLASDLISLLYDDAYKEALSDDDLATINYSPDGSPDRELLIPKLIHQTYKTVDIPEGWQAAQKSVIDLHPDYEYVLWTDEMAHDFIKENYTWFLPTFEGYPYPIMRADAIRYFVLYHYGGIYIDLDNGCTEKLDPLLTVPAWLRRTHPTGISNDLMGSVKRHPFFYRVIAELQKYNHNWFVSYITIMISTGPLFLSVMWKRYKRWGFPKGGMLRVLYPPKGEDHTKYFFFTVKGSSWHGGDAQFIMLMGRHWFICTILGTLIVLSLIYLQFRFYRWLASSNLKRFCRRLYSRLREFRTKSEGPHYQMLQPQSPV